MNPSHYATFDLQSRLRVQIVTYEDVSVCNMSPNFYVLSQPPCFHALCRLRDVIYLHTDMTLSVKTLCKVVFFYSEHASQSVVLYSMYSNTVSHVNSCIQKTVRKFKSRVVVFRFRYIGGKLCDKQGVICLKLRIGMTS